MIQNDPEGSRMFRSILEGPRRFFNDPEDSLTIQKVL